MPLNDAERAGVADAIRHFEALQKRYTRQHNGTACEHVKWALIGLKRLSDQPEVAHAYWKLSPLPGRPLRTECSWCGSEALFDYNMHDAVMYYCHKCGRPMDGERAGKERDDG